MTSLIYILVGIVIGFALAYFWGLGKKPINNKVAAINIARSKRKEKRKRKIIEALKEKDRITNNDIEELLGVSDATATNYLDELEREGKIVQQGKTGRSVFYTLK